MSESTSFESAIHELEALARQPVLPARQVGLSRARRLLAELGNPHHAFRAAHITGSSGKGSTTTMLGSILEAGGFTVGYLRSPHLNSYTERIAVGERRISEGAWAGYWSQLRPLVDAMASNELPDYQAGRPTFSEVIFAIAALHFRDSGIDWAVLEAGLGGRFDATNIVSSDVAVITTISLEHTQVLGTTLAAIASEKAAIIKPGSSAVTGATKPEALAVIEERAADVGAPFLRVPADVRFTVRSEWLEGMEVEIDLGDGSVNVVLRMAGSFQAHNAAVAAAAAISLRRRGVAVDRQAIVHGLEHALIPGRLEVVTRRPLVILDGAHHPAAVGALRASLDRLLAGRRAVLLFTALSDKNVAAMAEHLRGLAATVVLTTAPDTPRAVKAADLASHFSGGEAQVLLQDDPEQALEIALHAATEDGVLVICGSLYLVGYVRDILLRSRIAS